jgi:hypothetical protein
MRKNNNEEEYWRDVEIYEIECDILNNIDMEWLNYECD